MLVERLTQEQCQALAPRLREQDKADCAPHDFDPLATLTAALSMGPAWALLDPDDHRVMGAFGYCPEEKTIWSLWAEDLQVGHTRWVMQNTVTAVRTIVLLHNGGFLHNYVWEGNLLTLAWLRASKCFVIEEGERHPYKGLNYIRFYVKPLGDLE